MRKTVNINIILENKATPFTAPYSDYWTTLVVEHKHKHNNEEETSLRNYGVRLHSKGTNITISNITRMNRNGETVYEFKPMNIVADEPTIVIRGQYPQIRFSIFNQDWEQLSKKIPNIFTNLKLVKNIVSKRTVVNYNFINIYGNNKITNYWFAPEADQTDVIGLLQPNDMVKYRSIRYDKCIVSLNDKIKKETLRGADALLRLFQLYDLNIISWSKLQTELINRNALYSINEYKGKHTKKALKIINAILVKHTPRHVEEAKVYYDNRTGENNILYYKNYTIVDYPTISINCNDKLQYLLPKRIRNSKYLNLSYDENVKMEQHYTVTHKQKDEVGNVIPDENGNAVIIDDYHVDTDMVYDRVYKHETTMSGGITTVSGDYHKVIFANSNDEDSLLAFEASPNAEITDNTAWTGTTDIKVTSNIISPATYDWLNQFIGSNYRDKYTDKEILAILRYSIQSVYTMLELNMGASYAYYTIANDIHHLRELNYHGELWYRVITESRIMLDTGESDSDDPEDGTIDNKPIVYKNDWYDICANERNNYKIIDGKIYLIFKL